MKIVATLILVILLTGTLFGQQDSLKKFETNLKLETIGTLRQLFISPGYHNTLELELFPAEWELVSLHFWGGGFYRDEVRLFGLIPINDSPSIVKNYGYQFGAGFRRYLVPFKGEKTEKLNGKFYVQPMAVYQRYWYKEIGNPPQFSNDKTSINTLVYLGGQFSLKNRWLMDISTGWGYQFLDPTGIFVADVITFHPRIGVGYEIK